jgi:hypothetical protein
MLSARGIAAVVGAENHSSMLGGLGGGFLSLDIWVAEDDSEEAAALLRDLREPDLGAASLDSVDDDRDRRDLDDDGGDGRDASRRDRCDDDDGDGDGDGAHGVCAVSDAFHLQIDRRRRTGIALLLGCCITFGTAHMFTRAWLRGIALGALEIVGIVQVAAGHPGATMAIVGAVAVDVIGAVWRIWAAPSPPIPEARLLRLRR